MFIFRLVYFSWQHSDIFSLLEIMFSIFRKHSLFLFFPGITFINSYYKPGGLLEYAGRFLTQFYAGKLTGSLIALGHSYFTRCNTLLLQRRKFQKNTFSLLFILIPSCLLMLMQANYYHLMEYNIGFILILAYYLFSVLSDNKYYKILVLILWPLFYYLAGAYALIFAVMYIIHNLFTGKWNAEVYVCLSLTGYSCVSFLVFWKIIFLQPLDHVLFFPLPLLENTVYKSTFFILVCYLIFYPIICSSGIAEKYKWLNKRMYSFLSILFVFIIGVFILVKIYKPQTARVVELERLIFSEKWDRGNKISGRETCKESYRRIFLQCSTLRNRPALRQIVYRKSGFWTWRPGFALG